MKKGLKIRQNELWCEKSKPLYWQCVRNLLVEHNEHSIQFQEEMEYVFNIFIRIL